MRVLALLLILLNSMNARAAAGVREIDQSEICT